MKKIAQAAGKAKRREGITPRTYTEDAAGIVAYRAAQRARGERYRYSDAGDTADDAIVL